jgi:hypothetical protein
MVRSRSQRDGRLADDVPDTLEKPQTEAVSGKIGDLELHASFGIGE